jgi:hypothetical protein
MKAHLRLRCASRRSKKGQAITEYATVIAFVCFIIALAFSLAHGTLFAAISDAYYGTATALDRMNQAVAAHP